MVSSTRSKVIAATILKDVHFIVPFAVLLAGIILLIVLH